MTLPTLPCCRALVATLMVCPQHTAHQEFERQHGSLVEQAGHGAVSWLVVHKLMRYSIGIGCMPQ